MDPSKKAYIAMDVGGTYLKSAVLDFGGNVLEGSAFTVESHSNGSREEILHVFEQSLACGFAFIHTLSMEAGGIGIAFPGPFDYVKGIPLMKHKFKSIYQDHLRATFYKIPGVHPGIPILFVHDAGAVLEGEAWKGDARGFGNAAVVTIGTGLGFAFSQNEAVQCDELGGPKVSIYKIPCRDGILEDYAGKRGFLKSYKELSGNPDNESIEVSEIGKWADEGDPVSLMTFREVGNILSGSLRNILQEYDIQCLLFGGQISRSFHHMEESLRQGLKQVKCLQKVSRVKYIDNAALLGSIRNLIRGRNYKNHKS